MQILRIYIVTFMLNAMIIDEPIHANDAIQYPAINKLKIAPQKSNGIKGSSNNKNISKTTLTNPPKLGLKNNHKTKHKFKTPISSKVFTYSDIKHHETKKKLVIVEKSIAVDTRHRKNNDSDRTMLDTSDFNEATFAVIDFTSDIKEADYYDKKTLAEVKKEIASSTKPYILYFGANWCIPCRLMRETVFKAHDVKKYLSQFQITYVDVDNFDGMDIKELYNVTNIPYMVILNNKGKQLGRIEGSISSTNFSEKLKTLLQP